ncbi:hypothetical protein P153DRAFT_387085 [Dothidotthia symphoricarpi CBS 119687]|uniref:TEA domain-containing protein n=1 Tax=Dothidotthia symphoricarpi CBS 119687 TaxID=1392245 RepID=A0A6A6AAL2_9PLEO|nr:uncharacterized protein P153DRAFT_387085 [Dothidotthia symphoricarpi CBS 119687]KAF2128124.1 hypothetical protein P153DRAFT_387085 [Dothidotthia symphoricarpi CBS 119687]
MELQQLLPAQSPTSDPAYAGTPLERCSSQRVVLQERSANWPQECNITTIISSKPQHSPIPIENVFSPRVGFGGNCSTGNTHASHVALAGFSVERSEKQIEHDLKRLYKMLARSDKYQKYREKQPVMTPKELIAKEDEERARGKEEREKEKVVWPEFLERAFWRALVKWPPMGRKKYMLNGALRGRNELVQDFIARDTGIKRDRKQVSSHIQVLKQLLRDQPGVLIHMATLGNERRRHRGNESSSAYHLTHCHAQPQRGAPASNYSANVATWPYAPSLNLAPSPNKFSITHFAMVVEDGEHTVCTISELHPSGRLPDLEIADSAAWQIQYPEFDFLSPQIQEWARQDEKILVCDASLNTVVENRANAQLSITFDLHSQCDLSGFKALQCSTRFYDDMDTTPDNGLSKQNTCCEFDPESGSLQLAFGSAFWVDRMSQYQAMSESEVDSSLMQLTATQNVYGIQQSSGKVERILTILWHFRQTSDTTEVGSVKWRAVTFTPAERKWEEEPQTIVSHHEDLDPTSTPVLYQQLPLDFPTHYAYPVQHPHPPQLSLNTLASMCVPDFDPNASAAPSTATDYSHPSLAPSTATDHSFPSEIYDFSARHMAISGPEAFEPVINMASYDSFGSHALAGQGFEQDRFPGLGMACSVDTGLIHGSVPDTPDSACYPVKAPWLQMDFLPQVYGQVVRGDGVYHDEGMGGHVDVDSGLWNLASPF